MNKQLRSFICYTLFFAPSCALANHPFTQTYESTIPSNAQIESTDIQAVLGAIGRNEYYQYRCLFFWYIQQAHRLIPVIEQEPLAFVQLTEDNQADLLSAHHPEKPPKEVVAHLQMLLRDLQKSINYEEMAISFIKADPAHQNPAISHAAQVLMAYLQFVITCGQNVEKTLLHNIEFLSNLYN